jgi:ectoine hydroxylase-related dioxygenase (phytanoyl-CoA dioxygenase family)
MTRPIDMTSYLLVNNAAGDHLAATNGKLSFSINADDACMWRRASNGSLRASDGSAEISVEGGQIRLGDEVFATDAATQTGPARLPSEHLAEMRDLGYTVVEGIMDPADCAALKAELVGVRAAKHPDEPPTDGHFWITDSLIWSVHAVRAAVHPVALGLLRAYMGIDDIHFCHQPIITTLKPAKALLDTHPEGGWHSDYPYHTGVFPDEYWPPEQVFGVQFNLCIDDFRADNGATQFVPGSHKLGFKPPEAYNLGGTRIGDGQHDDVAQFVAPAGSAVLYDARTWHRACHELNQSGVDRIAMLNAVAPAWVLPMMPKAELGQEYQASRVRKAMTAREHRDVVALCGRPEQEAPADAPSLTLRRSARP